MRTRVELSASWVQVIHCRDCHIRPSSIPLRMTNIAHLIVIADLKLNVKLKLQVHSAIQYFELELRMSRLEANTFDRYTVSLCYFIYSHSQKCN